MAPLCSLLHCFQREIYSHPYLCFSVYNMPFSSGCFLDLLFITGFEQFDNDMLRCTFLHVSCALGLLSFIDLWIHSFHQVGKNFSHYFSNILSCSFRDANHTYIRLLKVVLHLTDALFFLKFIFLSVFHFV